MSKTYLLTRPEHDDTTYYLSNWIVMTVKTAENHGFKVLDMHREKATKINIEAMIKDFSPNLVVFNGHGSQDTVTGHDNKPLITCGVNEGILKSKIVYASPLIFWGQKAWLPAQQATQGMTTTSYSFMIPTSTVDRIRTRQPRLSCGLQTFSWNRF
jgi:hypothetical protein